MTALPELPPAAGPAVDGLAVDGSSDPVREDAVLAGRAMSAGVFLAGLVAAGELETVGRPDKLAADLFPHVAPEVVEAIWQRALAVGLYAGRRSADPERYRDELDRVRGVLEGVGYAAMGRVVGRSRGLVAPERGVHPADGEAGREH